MGADIELITEERVIVLPGDDETTVVEGAGDDPDEGLAALKDQLAKSEAETRAANERASREEARRAESDRRAGTASAQVREASTVAAAAQHSSIANALETTKSSILGLRRDHTAAMEAGDFAKASEIQAEMSLAAARQVSLENGKRAIEEQIEAAKKAPVQQPVQSDVDRQEAFLRAIPPSSAAWIRAHPQYFTDQQFKAKVDAAAGYLEQVEGMTYANADYYRRIEEATGLRDRAAPADDVKSAAATVTERKSANGTKPAAETKPNGSVPRVVPAAAPSRTVPRAENGGRGGSIAVTLTAEERQMARLTLTPEIIGVDPVTKLPRDPEVVFAQRKQEAIASGRRW